MSKVEIFLTESQYLDLLVKGRKNLNRIDKVEGHCDTTYGNKSTETNIGLCNTELTTQETAFYPKAFPHRKDMKYRRSDHKCPLDNRDEKPDYGWNRGCYWYCLFFQHNMKNIRKIKGLYDMQIRIVGKK